MTESLDTFVRKIFGKTEEQWDHEVRVNRLANYNAEVGRGLVHTQEWKDFMSAEQAWWDAGPGKLPS